jgi:Ca-activated chloride channel family protein
MARMLRVAVGLVGVLVGAATVWTPAQQSFRSSVGVVHVPAVVLDRAGRPVRGLTAADLVVREGGIEQAITSFAEGPPGPDVPLHLGLMLDKSESMEKDSRDAATAAVRFVEAVDEARDVTYVEFETGIRLARFAPPSYERLFARIRERGRGRTTALYDAMGHYAASIHERPGQHLLLLYTDGGDSSSRQTVAEIRDTLRAGNVLVYVIGYLEHASPSDAARFRGVLTSLARETGGEAFYPIDAVATATAYEQIRAEIAGRYTLGYVRSAATTRPGFRRVEVALKTPRPGVVVRARLGYVVR